MGKYNLSEAAKEVLNLAEDSKSDFEANVRAKQGQRAQGGTKPEVGASKLPTSVVSGQQDVGDVGHAPYKETDDNPDYTRGVPSATPPGATPPVSSEPMHRMSGQPQETMGRSDVKTSKQYDPTEYVSVRDRKKYSAPAQTFHANPGAMSPMVPEETDYMDGEMDEFKLRLQEDIAALISGEELSEEFVKKASTIFEAAVVARAEEVIAEAEQQLIEEFEIAVEETKNELSEKLDDYLNYMVEEWMSENELAIESGLRSEIVEEFIFKLRNLFVESYIDIPEDRVDVVGELVAKVEELESNLNEEIEKNVQFAKEIIEHRKLDAIRESCDGLTQTQAEKLKALAENVEYSSDEEFEDALSTLKESYFAPVVKPADSEQMNEEVHYEEEEQPQQKKAITDPDMSVYARAISKTLSK